MTAAVVDVATTSRPDVGNPVVDATFRVCVPVKVDTATPFDPTATVVDADDVFDTRQSTRPHRRCPPPKWITELEFAPTNTQFRKITPCVAVPPPGVDAYTWMPSAGLAVSVLMYPLLL